MMNGPLPLELKASAKFETHLKGQLLTSQDRISAKAVAKSLLRYNYQDRLSAEEALELPVCLSTNYKHVQGYKALTFLEIN